MIPLYRDLYRKGQLKIVKEQLLEALGDCRLCPRNCGANRLRDKTGFCRTGRYAHVSSYFLHHGEERELVGRRGSGTIFFSYCNLGCLYCQNYTLSHAGEGAKTNPEELAEMMLRLQGEGAENINFVTPTHVIAQIIEALEIAASQGLALPLVYNCGGYERLETLQMVRGIFDIYMPDAKYSDNAVAAKYSQAADYWDLLPAVLKEMHGQVGDLVIDDSHATRGLLIRHLVLPNRLAGSFKLLDFIRDELSSDTYVNIMQQYYPCYHAGQFSELSRRVSHDEYAEVLSYARKIGLSRGF